MTTGAQTMKQILLAAALVLLSSAALAQPVPTGQSPGGAINPTTYSANSDSVGFSEDAITLLTVPGTSTAQATFSSNGALATGTLITTRVTVITACSGTTGVTLPAVQHYVAITVINRSGGSCLVWPTIGTTVETALGTDGSTNAAFTQLTNTDVNYRPIPTAGGSVKWVQ